MENLYSIGEFSRMCRLSVKALRLYDEQGILKPGHTDQASGYRYYSSAQLDEENLVRMLRALRMPLDEIRELLRVHQPAARLEVLERHRARVEEELASCTTIVAATKRLLEGEEKMMDRSFELKELAPQPVLGVRFRTVYTRMPEEIGKAFGTLFGLLSSRGEFPAGPPLSLFYGEDFDEDDIDMEICVPTARVLEGEGEVKGYLLDGCKAVSTLHMGPFDKVGDAWQPLMMWIDEKGYRPAGPGREVYLVGPGQANDPADYRTEVMCPVEGGSQDRGPEPPPSR
jgi:effector-binding domain-containing protein